MIGTLLQLWQRLDRWLNGGRRAREAALDAALYGAALHPPADESISRFVDNAPEPVWLQRPPRVEAFHVVANRRLANGLWAHVFAYPGWPKPVLVIMRWPSDLRNAGGAMPIQLYEGRCDTVATGLRWARRNAHRFADRALDRD